jgi:hypothetical protein
MITKNSKKKWKKLKKTLRRMEKKMSMEHQNPFLWVVTERRHKIERKSWKENLNLNSCTTYIILCTLVYYFTYIHEIYLI